MAVSFDSDFHVLDHAIKRFHLGNVGVGEAYMSPSSVTEILHFYVAEYSEDMTTGHGGGLEEEQENIEVVELPFAQALDMVESGEIRDAKTIMLLQYAQIQGLLKVKSKPLHILIAGPYRSGTNDDHVLIEKNVSGCR
ncbi:hypothetical protein [Paenibacillus donghaensis]|uniref:hypothetical protein n=1 Tax=Paenibacillus donghaensis TaxID=414771 RepID=UPI001FE250EA|nr:hypothetical protein [Paenibacillus donghaensis]